MDNSKTVIKSVQDSISPAQAVELLKEGNKRFTSGNPISRNHAEQVKDTLGGQWPFAVVLGCIDSRVPSEIVFDQGIVDIFNVRVAGNFVNVDVLGSIEYACKVAGSKAIVVLGHSSCGAVKGACDGVELGNITDMLSKITPAVEAVSTDGERNSSNGEFVQGVVDKNIEMTMENIKNQSPVLKEMIENGEVELVGGMYDVSTGEVKW